MPTASLLQRLLTEEGAFFNPRMQVLPISSMGGGYGVIATEPLSPGTLLATIPKDSMITPSKARQYLAQCEYKQRQSCLDKNLSTNNTVNITALKNLEKELEYKLSPANTIICFLLLKSLKYDRFTLLSNMKTNNTSFNNNEENVTNLENDHTWMKPWLLSLPLCYDNLLELKPKVEKKSFGEKNEYNESSKFITTDEYLRSFLCFQRHRQKVLREQRNVEKEFNTCKSVLSVLNAFNPQCNKEESLVQIREEEFLWAYNTLMSRGFSYEPEIWALMPWVDYFNYALISNATMKFDNKSNKYIFETVLPIKTGEQILLHYGSYTDMELLLWYGFTITPFLIPEFSINNSYEEKIKILRILLNKDKNIKESIDDFKSIKNDLCLKSIHTALGYCFSEWAEADGSYPQSKLHESWFELLLVSYFKAIKNTSDNNNNTNYYPFAFKLANLLVKTFVVKQISHSPSQLMAYDCRLGARGPSESMLELLKYVSRVCLSIDKGCGLTPIGVLRAVCWAELFCNNLYMKSSKAPVALVNPFDSDNVILDSSMDPVRRMSRQASLDSAFLLYFLAVEATEKELDLYLKRDCE